MTVRIRKSNDVQLRRQISEELDALEAAITAAVSDTAYAASWDGVTTIAPSKNAVYDKIEALLAVQNVLNGFRPALMQFNGSTGFYNATYTSSGNKVTLTAWFKRTTFTGGGTEYLMRSNGPSGAIRLGLFLSASDHATAGRQNKLGLIAQNSASTIICRFFSTSNLCDNALHLVVADFDGDAGTATFTVDGANADDTGNAERIAPTTGTLSSGASSVFLVGAGTATPTLLYGGQLGYVGMRDIDGLTHSDFRSNGRPKDLDETAWTEWGAQPLFWNPHGQMDNSTGSATSMTKNGTIRVWWEGLGNTIGLNI